MIICCILGKSVFDKAPENTVLNFKLCDCSIFKQVVSIEKVISFGVLLAFLFENIIAPNKQVVFIRD